MSEYKKSVKEEVCSFENLYKAMYKCKRNVIWKDSVAGFVKNGLINCVKLHDELMEDTYKISKYSTFEIHEPKKRSVTSTQMRDRVVQRSICDNYLSKELSRSFIYDNCACLEGKGTNQARSRFKAHLQKFYRKHGTDGYVLKCDISNYFGSTNHNVASDAIHKRVEDEWVLEQVDKIIFSYDNCNEDKNVGLGIGSQVTQLIQLAVLDDLDHYIKEVLRIKHYIRYMDDFILVHEDKEYLKHCKMEIKDMLSKKGLMLSDKKTQIFKISQPIHFLGFSFKLTKTGYVVMKILPKRVSHERRKLKRLVELSKKGVISKSKVDHCFESWKSYVDQGDCYSIIKAMDSYYNQLWKENV